MPKTSISGMVAALFRASAAVPTLMAAAAGTDFDWTLLAAIGVRESAFQNIARSGGGITSNWAANLLLNNMAILAAKYPNLTPTQLLQATTASYNFGAKNISGNPNTIDVGTTGNNYGSNVLNLMDCFH